jgi:Bacteriocin-protection, YdeI or OmpD-Associated/Domain of unknown function (DUF1905)
MSGEQPSLRINRASLMCVSQANLRVLAARPGGGAGRGTTSGDILGSVASTRTFSTVLRDSKGRVYIPLPFDPVSAWGPRSRFYVHGSVNSMGVRGVVQDFDDRLGLVLGEAWRRGCGLQAGDQVDVKLMLEGLQRSDLPSDVATALEEETKAGAFFDSVAPYYRNAFLKWIEATKRSPEVRSQRIAEMVALLVAGEKEIPQRR